MPAGDQTHWNASICKNTANAVAAGVFGDAGYYLADLVVCNVDGDNVVPGDFVELMLAPAFAGTLDPEAVPGSASSSHGPGPSPWCCVAHQGKGGTEAITGRIAAWWRLFEEAGGYDCGGTKPTGFQGSDPVS